MPVWRRVSFPPLATPPYVVPFQLASNYLCDPTPDTSDWLLGSLSPSLPARSQWHRHWRFLYFELLPYSERNHKEHLETCKHWAKQSTLLHPQTSRDGGCPVDVANRGPVSHSLLGSLVDRGWIGVCTFGWASTREARTPGTAAGFSLCL